jgi:hypothetical protein
MNNFMIEKKRARWIKENAPAEGKKAYGDLPLELQEEIMLVHNVNKTGLELRAAEAEATLIYTYGFTADTFDFTEINFHIVTREDFHEEAKARLNRFYAFQEAKAHNAKRAGLEALEAAQSMSDDELLKALE